MYSSPALGGVRWPWELLEVLEKGRNEPCDLANLSLLVDDRVKDVVMVYCRLLPAQEVAEHDDEGVVLGVAGSARPTLRGNCRITEDANDIVLISHAHCILPVTRNGKVGVEVN